MKNSENYMKTKRNCGSPYGKVANDDMIKMYNHGVPVGIAKLYKSLGFEKPTNFFSPSAYPTQFFKN